jgi:hypothetical protein
MAEVNGWSHNEMMEMPKRTLFRYYGVWLIRRIERQEQEERERRNEENQKRRNDPSTQWKKL